MPDAFLYDFLLANGGAEQLAITTAGSFPNMQLHTGFINPDLYDEDVAHTLTGPVSHPALQAIKMLYVFRNKMHDLADFDTVIYSGSYAPVAVWNHGNGKNIYYCNTPPRFVYDLKDYYLNKIPVWQRPVLNALIHYVQPRFEQAVEKMDCVIANSRNVQQRLRNYLGVDSDVVYPPVDTTCYRWQGCGDYYLSTARLEPYKRVDLIVKAFLEMPDRQLIVTSGGSDTTRLKQLARNAANIQFTGWISQQQLVDLVANAIATIYLPLDEDFGISPVESMAAGKPVIGVAEGGLLETVIDGETGILIKAVNQQKLIEAVGNLSRKQCDVMRESCEQQAQQFNTKYFLQQIHRYLRG
ncbi:MAG TPA: glycosyltransferase family 4 protein [Crenotrichaceae bacterium]|nr:glycosyltransferase family 4 protein [Crenotrichaceae bacterium]